jgi:hypothetical protein
VFIATAAGINAIHLTVSFIVIPFCYALHHNYHLELQLKESGKSFGIRHGPSRQRSMP